MRLWLAPTGRVANFGRDVLRWIGGGLGWLFLGLWAAAVIGVIVRWAVVQVWSPVAIISIVSLVAGAFCLSVGGPTDDYRGPFEDADAS